MSAQQAYSSRAWQRPADTRLIQDLVSRCWRADWPLMHFHAGDLDWWSTIAYGAEPGLEGRIRLWFAGEPGPSDVVAYGWFGPPGELDFVIDPHHRGSALIAELIHWFEERINALGGGQAGRLGGLDTDAIAPPAGGRPDLVPTVYSVEADAATAALLATFGFVPAADQTRAYHHFTRELDGTEAPSGLPPGYTVRTIEAEADIAGRVKCGHAAFPGSTMSVEKYGYCRSTPLYRSSLDTIVIAPDGSVAAFALGWFDGLSESVELEPVGVHPDHQRKGLGTIVCLTTLQTAYTLGARQALIASAIDNAPANALYASLGLTIATRIIPYRRSIA